MTKPHPEKLTVYLAFDGFENELKNEIPKAKALGHRLFISEEDVSPLWAQDIWRNCEVLSIDSISDAAKKLKARGKFWKSFSWNWHRRATLIQESLPKFKVPPLEFLNFPELPPFGVWTLLDQQQILLSMETKASRPLGENNFVEDKVTPPSRAYLKLWELFTVHEICPPQGALVVDIGSAPGGWTWVLQQVGCQVISVDKAPLDKKIATLPGVQALKKDAFKLSPEDIPTVQWLFSDIICYPKKLFEYLQAWLPLPVNLVCTIKFQGSTDQETLHAFSRIPNSHLIHLFHNKHEVTWVRLHDKT